MKSEICVYSKWQTGFISNGMIQNAMDDIWIEKKIEVIVASFLNWRTQTQAQTKFIKPK